MNHGGALAALVGTIGLLIIGYFLSTGLGYAEDTYTTTVGAKEKIYTENRYQVIDWDLHMEEGFLINDYKVSLDTSTQTFNYEDIEIDYIKSEKEYSYLTTIQIKDVETDFISSERNVVALTEDDLKQFSKDYSEEFRSTLEVEDVDYETLVDNLVKSKKHTNYSRKLTEHLEVETQ